jgi:hypothetical protein
MREARQPRTHLKKFLKEAAEAFTRKPRKPDEAFGEAWKPLGRNVRIGVRLGTVRTGLGLGVGLALGLRPQLAVRGYDGAVSAFVRDLMATWP